MNNKLGIVKFLIGVSIFIITLFIFFPLPFVYTCLYIKYSVNPSDITPEVFEKTVDKKPKDLHSLLSIFRKKSTSMNQYLSKMKNIDEIRDDLKKGTPYLMNKVKFDKINWFFSEKDKEKVKYIYDIPLFSTWSQAEGMGNYDAVGYFFLDDELKILGWSIGCMIVGSQYLEGKAIPDIYKVHPSYMIPIHVFDLNDSLLKAEELSKFACCVKCKLKKNPSVKAVYKS